MEYGFQETDTEDKKDAFWDYLDEEITEATNAEAGRVRVRAHKSRKHTNSRFGLTT